MEKIKFEIHLAIKDAWVSCFASIRDNLDIIGLNNGE